MMYVCVRETEKCSCIWTQSKLILQVEVEQRRRHRENTNKRKRCTVYTIERMEQKMTMIDRSREYLSTSSKETE